VTYWGRVALASAVLLLASLSASRAGAAANIECQHPAVTGVEVYRLHHITSRGACPVALALFRWETTGGHQRALYGCHGIGHPYLRLHSFHGWHLALTRSLHRTLGDQFPDFVMSRHGAWFAVGGTDFPINCS
jgi:hypothetical protein